MYLHLVSKLLVSSRLMQLVQSNVSLIIQLVPRTLEVNLLGCNMLGHVSFHLRSMVKLHALRHVVANPGLAHCARLAKSGVRSSFAVSHLISNLF
jgi:hypothetical protein